MKLKMLNIDDDMFEFLKDKDASKLMRELLRDYMRMQEPMSIEQKEIRIKELKAKLKYEQALKAIKNGND